MEWEDYRHFLAVARSGSLAGAARALKTSPATVGRHIAVLERRLAARLFERNQNGYALTENGEAIRLKAESIEEAILSTEREAFGRDLRVTGKVRVATADDIASYIIAPRLADFRKSYPGIVLEIAASWDVVNLTRREADLALRTARPLRGDYIIRRVGVWNCAVYASRRYADVHCPEAERSDLSRLDLITWTEESTFRGGDWLENHLRGATVVFMANSRHAQYAACKAGLGIAVLPCIAADRDPDLVQLLPPERVRSVDLLLVAHRDLARTARVRAAMDFLTEIAPS
jgi:DNA-binding transcriptional LysR family regulator